MNYCCFYSNLHYYILNRYSISINLMWKCINDSEEREKFDWEKYEQSSEFLQMKRCADNGDIESQRSLGFYYDDKAYRSDEIDECAEDLSTEYFTKAAKQLDAESCYHLGKNFEYSQVDLAYRYFITATSLGHAGAMCKLGEIYEYGYLNDEKIVDENWEEAIRLFRESAKRKYANAYSHLAELYWEGQLLPLDLEKALLHEKKAIKLFQHLPETDDLYDVWQYSEWRLLGDIYLDMGNINEARQAYLKGKEKDSDCKERLEELKNKR